MALLGKIFCKHLKNKINIGIVHAQWVIVQELLVFLNVSIREEVTMYTFNETADGEVRARIKEFLILYYYQLHGDESGYQEIENPFEAMPMGLDGKLGSQNVKMMTQIQSTLALLNKNMLEPLDLELSIENSYFTLKSEQADAKKILNELMTQQINSLNNFDLEHLYKTSFFTRPAKGYLSPTGVALVLDYHAQKYPSSCNTFVATDRKNIIEAIGLMHQEGKTGDEVGILWFNDGHWSAIKIENDENKKLHIIHMDALEGYNNIAEVIKFLSPDMQKNIVKYEFSEIRQGPANECSIFALKDMQKMVKTKHLYLELAKKPHVIPARFMNVAQKPELFIQKYEQAQNLGDAEKGYWKGKGGKNDSLVEYAFLSRNNPEKSRVVPVDPVTGKRLDQTATGKRLNRTIAYFRDKYVHSVVIPMLETYNITTLSAIVQKYDSNNLSMERIRSRMDRGETKQQTENIEIQRATLAENEQRPHEEVSKVLILSKTGDAEKVQEPALSPQTLERTITLDNPKPDNIKTTINVKK